MNVHGGAWYTGDKSMCHLLSLELQRRGVSVANINYRLPAEDPVPAMVEDVVAAIRWAPRPAFVAGDSAGAHLAVLAALDAPVLGVVSFSGALDLAALNEDHPRFPGYRTTLGSAANPMDRVGELRVPLLAFSSALDFFLDATERFVRAAGGTLVYYDETHPDCTHSWQNNPRLAESQETYDRVASFVASAPS